MGISSLVSSLALVLGCSGGLDSPTPHQSSFLSLPSTQSSVPTLLTSLVTPGLGFLARNREQSQFTWRHSSQHVTVSLPLLTHTHPGVRRRRNSALVALQGSTGISHLCFLKSAHFSPLHTLSWWKVKPLAVALGFSHTWQRAVAAAALAPLPQTRKSWPRTSKAWSGREEGHSYKPAGAAASCCAPHSPNASGSTKNSRAPLGQELTCERTEGAGGQTSTARLIWGILCSETTLPFYSQLLHDLSQGAEVLGALVLCYIPCSHPVVFLRPFMGISCFASIKQSGTEVLTTPSAAYSSGGMRKVGCSCRLKRWWMENCWEMLI